MSRDVTTDVNLWELIVTDFCETITIITRTITNVELCKVHSHDDSNREMIILTCYEYILYDIML